MATKTTIEWTEATWNPVRGCSRVSEGCRNCYAERVAARFSKPGMPYEGLAVMKANGPHWTGEVRLIEEHLQDPLKWRTPRRVFVNSMSDLFHESLSDFNIQRVFDVMYYAPQHAFQILTKRAKRMHDFLNSHRTWWGDYPQWKHVWLGVSVENQKEADERIPLLLQTPAAVRWLSCEPLLGPVNIAPWLEKICPVCRFTSNFPFCPMCKRGREHGIHWVVVGGESGPGARPMHPDWARSLRDQCEAAGVPFFFKQWGAWAPLPEPFHYRPAIGSGNREYNSALRRFAKKHGAARLLADHPDGWSKAMIDRGTCILNGGSAVGLVGKKKAGRLLDGKEYSQFPAPPAPRPAHEGASDRF